jgi:hypothetical protein
MNNRYKMNISSDLHQLARSKLDNDKVFCLSVLCLLRCDAQSTSHHSGCRSTGHAGDGVAAAQEAEEYANCMHVQCSKHSSVLIVVLAVGTMSLCCAPDLQVVADSSRLTSRPPVIQPEAAGDGSRKRRRGRGSVGREGP